MRSMVLGGLVGRIIKRDDSRLKKSLERTAADTDLPTGMQGPGRDINSTESRNLRRRLDLARPHGHPSSEAIPTFPSPPRRRCPEAGRARVASGGTCGRAATRARSGLCAAAGLLLAFAALLALPLQAQAQTEIWSATLTIAEPGEIPLVPRGIAPPAAGVGGGTAAMEV